MKPDKLSVFDLFQMQRRYVVPLYQRPYVWDRENQWEPLWDDLRRQANLELHRMLGERTQRGLTHFLGAVVLNQIPTFGKEVAAREIIDGQQRLTTLQIYLSALASCARDMAAADVADESAKLTRNSGMMAEPHEAFKVWPTNVDRGDFRLVLDASGPDAIKEQFPTRRDGSSDLVRARMAEAYLFFFDSIASYAKGEDGDEEAGAFAQASTEDRLLALFSTLKDSLQFVVIELEDDDDPQVIFETLNARGTPLLPSDLIRNHTFMIATRRKEKVDALYDRYWRPFDEELEDPKNEQSLRFWKMQERQGRLTRPRIDLFMFHYLVFRTEREIMIGELFREFRAWRGQVTGTEGTETFLSDLNRYRDAFRTFCVPDMSTRRGLFLRRLKDLDTSTVYPLLLHLFGDEAADPEELDAIAVDLESFLMRRYMCRLTNKNYNRFFLGLLRKIRQRGAATREAVREELLASEADTARWPGDAEFERHWLSQPAYTRFNAYRCVTILSALEEALRGKKTEKVTINEPLTVEHVLPRKYSEADYPLPSEIDGNPLSAEEAVDGRRALIHSFGNLTLLTGALNTSISNGPFDRKRREVADHSVLRLNDYWRGLKDDAVWDENAILTRGRALFELARTVWPRP